jgi:triacylglycerol lipase
MRSEALSVLVCLALVIPGCAADGDAENVGGSTEAMRAVDPSAAPYPVVLLHGMAGFGKLTVGNVTLSYFQGVVDDLARHGETAWVTVVPPFAGSETRAQALAPQIDEILRRTGKAKVNLVAHSQGGLDARILASPAGLG